MTHHGGGGESVGVARRQVRRGDSEVVGGARLAVQWRRRADDAVALPDGEAALSVAARDAVGDVSIHSCGGEMGMGYALRRTT